jgi:hypothetical protein
MKLNVMFVIAAIVLILTGILELLAPVIPVFGVIDASAYFSALISAAPLLAFGVVAWLVRNAEASKTRQALVLGYILWFGLWAVVSVIGQFGQFSVLAGHQASWMIGLVQALVAVGFIVAGRSSMAKSAA